MREHRFAFNFGYGFNAGEMTSVVLLFTSMFLELGLEVVVDSAAISIEYEHGIDLESFWHEWREYSWYFFGLHIASSLLALFMVFWSFSTLPSAFFCTSPRDPCSCMGGSFEILERFCNATPVNETLDFTKKSAQNEYVGVFESLEGASTIIIVSVVTIVVVALIFMIARSNLFAAKAAAEAEREREEAQREREEAERRERELLEHNERIQEQNRQIQDQLLLTQLNAKQVAIVDANSLDLDKQVPAMFQLNWRDLLFEGRLGSGSFGDCYSGR